MHIQPASPSVLIVEDELLIRFYEAEFAEGAGLETIQAQKADEALQDLDGSIQFQIQRRENGARCGG